MSFMPNPGSLVRLQDGRIGLVTKVTPLGDDDRVWTGSSEETSEAWEIAEVLHEVDPSAAKVPARCSCCGVVSERRTMGTTPLGWMRGRVKPGDSDHGRYWCPACAVAAGWKALA